MIYYNKYNNIILCGQISMVVSGFSKFFPEKNDRFQHQGIALDIISLRTTIEGGGWREQERWVIPSSGIDKPKSKATNGAKLWNLCQIMSNLMVSVEVFQKKLLPDMFWINPFNLCSNFHNCKWLWSGF